MYFPWVGYLEQVRLADVFVHYDDVQFTKNNYYNRVQVKTAHGSTWMTAPVRHESRQRLDRVRVHDGGWRIRHLRMLEQSLARAPYRDDALDLAEQVLDLPTDSLAELAIAGIEGLAAYFGLDTEFVRSSQLGPTPDVGATARVVARCEQLGADRYVTGHGGADYLEHEAFERSGIAVEYMDYARQPYPQQHGAFDPHVSTLDLVANCGPAGRAVLTSGTLPWREFVPTAISS